MEDNNKSSGAYNIKWSWMAQLPILILIAIVPFVVRLSVVELDELTGIAFRNPQVTDFFSYYKSLMIIILAAICILVLFLVFQKKDLKRSKVMNIYYISAAVFVGFTALSAFFSKYRQVSMWGAPDRNEGLIITVAYVVIFLYTIYIIRSTEDYNNVVYALCILVVGTGILGVFQYFGKDILLGTNFGKKLIVPEEYGVFRDQIAGTYEKGKIYGTMFHYNYVGSFGAMVVPLFATLTLFLKGKKKKLLFGTMTLISLFILLGSTSRAGLVGVSLSVVAFIIIFSKKIIKGYKIVLPVIVGLIVVLFIFNQATGGTIFERVPTLVKDAFSLFTPGDNTFDYRDYLPVRDIQNHDGKVTLSTQDDSITLATDGEVITFRDKAGELIEYTLVDATIVTQDVRFANIAFEVVDAKSGELPQAFKVIIDNRDTFVIRTNTENEIYLADSYTGEKLTLDNPLTIGFKGKEKIGSARGYIWSRSIPMIKNTLFLGNGPDTYLLTFPQKDLLGKYYAYDTPNMTVDKPHNLYLQFAINNGVVALLGFLVLVITYLVESIRLYMYKSFYSTEEVIGSAVAIAIIGYLGAGIFNDSIVSVAPIFWVLLGLGIAINYIISKNNIRVGKLAEHSIINMKTKRHIG